jgi:hypothetical protein
LKIPIQGGKSTMAKRLLQLGHDRMVKHVAKYLMARNFKEVKADIPGFYKPEEITWKDTGKGHIPDVTAHGNKRCLFEVETSDSIFGQHTEDQWRLFAAYAKEQNAKFWVVVSHGLAPAANKRLEQLGIQAEVWQV